MNILETAIVLIGLVLLATVLGLVWRARNGRIVCVTEPGTISGNRVTFPNAPTFGSCVTLLQFSTVACAPCATTHSLLSSLALELDDGTGQVVHVDIDVTARPELAKQLNLLQSPTTFILDGDGVLQARISGAPKISAVRAELERMLCLELV